MPHIFFPETGFVTAMVPDLVEGAFVPNRVNKTLVPRFQVYFLVIIVSVRACNYRLFLAVKLGF